MVYFRKLPTVKYNNKKWNENNTHIFVKQLHNKTIDLSADAS